MFLGRIAQGQALQIWGDGEVVRDFFHVDDLAAACVAAATCDQSTGIYNVGSGRGVSLNELLSVIEQVVDKPVRIERSPARSFDVPQVYLDITRASRALAWSPKVALCDGLAQTWEWVRKLDWQHEGDEH